MVNRKIDDVISIPTKTNDKIRQSFKIRSVMVIIIISRFRSKLLIILEFHRLYVMVYSAKNICPKYIDSLTDQLNSVLVYLARYDNNLY